MVYNGQPIPVHGWYVDAHGHRLLLRSGDPAPICPRFGPATVVWRLVMPIPEIKTTT